MKHYFTATVCIALLAIQSAFAQIETELIPTSRQAREFFGASVSIDGDYALAGMPFDGDSRGEDVGSVYVFKADGGTWSQQAKLNASDATAGDFFGIDVAIEGDLAVISAAGDDDLGDRSGAAYIFRFNGARWIQEAKLRARDGSSGDQFGSAVAISGNRVLIGAYTENANGDNAGAAYVFRYTGSVWVQEAKLTASDGEANQFYGLVLAISGDRAIVGAGGSFFTRRVGAAYVYRLIGASWGEEVKLEASNGANSDGFGDTVAIDGERILVGADGKAAAYVFNYNGSEWVEDDIIIGSSTRGRDRFGSAVALDGDIAIVAAVSDDEQANAAGAVYVFQRFNEEWIQRHLIRASNAMEEFYFGNDISVSEGRVIIGAEGRFPQYGGAYVYDLELVTSTEVEHNGDISRQYQLGSNYPNPFNQSTQIPFTLEKAGHIRLSVYDVLGKQQALLLDQFMPVGMHTVAWNGRGPAGNPLPSGSYVYRLEVDGEVSIKTMTQFR